MNAKTMEGLAGAGASMAMMSVPMNVAKEAERKGETDKMQRALGYAAELTEQAEKYSEKASQGMKQEAKEAREKEKLRQEKLLEEKRAEGQEKSEQAGEKAGNVPGAGMDLVEISEEGKAAAETAGQAAAAEMAGQTAVVGEPIQNVCYDRSGESMEIAPISDSRVDVSV